MLKDTSGRSVYLFLTTGSVLRYGHHTAHQHACVEIFLAEDESTVAIINPSIP